MQRVLIPINVAVLSPKAKILSLRHLVGVAALSITTMADLLSALNVLAMKVRNVVNFGWQGGGLFTPSAPLDGRE